MTNLELHSVAFIYKYKLFALLAFLVWGIQRRTVVRDIY